MWRDAITSGSACTARVGNCREALDSNSSTRQIELSMLARPLRRNTCSREHMQTSVAAIFRGDRRVLNYIIPAESCIRSVKSCVWYGGTDRTHSLGAAATTSIAMFGGCHQLASLAARRRYSVQVNTGLAACTYVAARIRLLSGVCLLPFTLL